MAVFSTVPAFSRFESEGCTTLVETGGPPARDLDPVDPISRHGSSPY